VRTWVLMVSVAGLSKPVLVTLTKRIQSLLSSHATSLSPNKAHEEYLLTARASHGGHALWVFARESTLGRDGRLGKALTSRLGLFYGGMGNKGAVGVRLPIRRGDGEGGWEVFTYAYSIPVPQ
jgi:hypothetical protein